MDINLAKNVFNGVNLVTMGHFGPEFSKFGHFGGQNDVIDQNFGKVVTNFFSKIF